MGKIILTLPNLRLVIFFACISEEVKKFSDEFSISFSSPETLDCFLKSFAGQM